MQIYQIWKSALPQPATLFLKELVMSQKNTLKKRGITLNMHMYMLHI